MKTRAFERTEVRWPSGKVILHPGKRLTKDTVLEFARTIEWHDIRHTPCPECGFEMSLWASWGLGMGNVCDWIPCGRYGQFVPMEDHGKGVK